MGLDPGSWAAIIGTAASLAGTGASVAAASAQQDEMDKAVRQQLLQQKGFQKRGTELFQASQQKSTPRAAQQQIGQGEEKAKQLYAQLQSVPMATLASPSVTPANAAVDTQRQAEYGRVIGAPNAALQGLTDYNLQQWIKNLQAQTGLGVNSLLSQNAASVLPYRIQDASTSQQGLQGLGSLLSTAGNLAGMYGASRGGGFLGTRKPLNPYVGGYDIPASDYGVPYIDVFGGQHP